MRVLVATALCCITFLTSGCSFYQQEKFNRGGYVDYLADKYWLKADSKAMRALRAYAIQVSLARIASVSAKNETDRQLLAVRLGATTQKFVPVFACTYDSTVSPPRPKPLPCFWYDSAMLDYSTALFDLAVVALPVEEAKKLLEAATESLINPLNIADVLGSLIDLGREAWKYGRVVGAIYRDTAELEVQVWLSTPHYEPQLVSEADVAELHAIYTSRKDDMTAWLGAVTALRTRGLEPVPHPGFFTQLSGLMRYLCNLITKDPDALRICQANLPTGPDIPEISTSVLRPNNGVTLTSLIAPPVVRRVVVRPQTERAVERPAAADVCAIPEAKIAPGDQRTLRDFYCGDGYVMARAQRRDNLIRALRRPPVSLPDVSVTSFIIDTRHEGKRAAMVKQIDAMKWLDKSQ